MHFRLISGLLICTLYVVEVVTQVLWKSKKLLDGKFYSELSASFFENIEAHRGCDEKKKEKKPTRQDYLVEGWSIKGGLKI